MNRQDNWRRLEKKAGHTLEVGALKESMRNSGR